MGTHLGSMVLWITASAGGVALLDQLVTRAGVVLPVLLTDFFCPLAVGLVEFQGIDIYNEWH